MQQPKQPLFDQLRLSDGYSDEEIALIFERDKDTGRDIDMTNKDDDLRIDKEQCLKTLQKIKQSGLSGFSEIENIQAYIEELKQEISDRQQEHSPEE
ncbi:hypothetical protein [Pseudanabaena sp. UWO310]|uniref:hypothetical protein n=1 Tax=Pseudanabaena sp. UWO310 TaxID=2480795 RepID=UPI001157C357|nr:hypothetical protein [Pseudanabaena sp. UWO310]TYQ31615.1 hypothetical protein PseudUWO310_02610 [Pseudanabaena sp. UWO310]